MGERRYVVIDTVTITGVGEVMARSKAEAVEKATNGEVIFDYDQGQVFRRGDGLRAERFAPTSVRPVRDAGDEEGT